MARLLFLILSLLATSCWAGDLPPFVKKKLPNGDIKTTYSSSDGAKVEALQHKDGTSEATTVALDGTKSVVIMHKDGNVETHTFAPNSKKELLQSETQVANSD